MGCTSTGIGSATEPRGVQQRQQTAAAESKVTCKICHEFFSFPTLNTPNIIHKKAKVPQVGTWELGLFRCNCNRFWIYNERTAIYQSICSEFSIIRILFWHSLLQYRAIPYRGMEMPSLYERISAQDGNQFSSRMVVSNVDVFFTNMYKFFYQRGLAAVLLTQICGIVSLGFTVCFSIFLVAYVDWHSLMQCRDESSCQNFSAYVVSHPFKHSTHRAVGSLVYMLLVLTYWVWKCAESVKEITCAMEMDLFFREKLNINNELLQNIEWDEVLDGLITLHEARAFRIVVKETLTEHDIVSRIMRKENYMVAMINKELLNLRAPWWISPFVGSESLILTKSLEWALNWCILEPMFNVQTYTISSTFLTDKQGLAWRFVLVGAIHFMLLPFMLVFMIIHFFLENAQQFHAQKAYLGPRQWSPLSLWTFREFNELPHVFEERINMSMKPTTEYLGLFYNPYLALLARCVSYIAGSFVATLLIISFIDESILMYVNALEHNLLWYLGIFSATLAAARALIPDEKKVVGTGAGTGTPGKDAEQLVASIAAHTHYKPAEWSSKCHTVNVFNAISEMFPFRAQIFVMEIYSVLITPIVLCFSLPDCVDSIVDFVREHTRYVDGVGSVVDYATFECFEKYGDDTFGGPAGTVDVSERAVDGKMEKSFLNFHNAHPHWRPKEAGGQAVIDKLHEFRNGQTRAREEKLQEALYQSGLFGMGMGMGSNVGPGVSRSRMGPQMAGMPRVSSDQSYPSFSPTNCVDEVPQDNRGRGNAGGGMDAGGGDELPPPAPVQLQRQVSDGLDPPQMEEHSPLAGAAGVNTASSEAVGIDSSSGTGIGIGIGPGGRSAKVSGVGLGPHPRPPAGGSPRPIRLQRNISSGYINGPPAGQNSFHRSTSASGLFGRGGSGAGGGVMFSGSCSRFPAGVGGAQGGNTACSNEELSNGQLNSLLQSVLRGENIDYENDFYWMDMVRLFRCFCTVLCLVYCGCSPLLFSTLHCRH